MCILGVKTGLIPTIEANGTPKTYLRWRLDTGAGLADSNEEVPLGNASTASLGTATTGAATAERVIKKAINLLQDVALV